MQFVILDSSTTQPIYQSDSFNDTFIKVSKILEGVQINSELTPEDFIIKMESVFNTFSIEVH